MSDIVLVDKVHTQEIHRRPMYELLDKLNWRSRGGRTLMVELALEGARGLQEVNFCYERIEGRGAAHATLHPDLEAKRVIKRFLREAEGLSAEEAQHFDAQVKVDTRIEATDKASQVLEALRDIGYAEAPPTRPPLRSEDWVVFAADEATKRPTFFWNRRARESVWEMPSYMMPGWHGFVAVDGRPYFRSATTLASTWELPPLLGEGSPASASASSLRERMEAEWDVLRREETCWSEHTAKK